jgi:hypothetical protein
LPYLSLEKKDLQQYQTVNIKTYHILLLILERKRLDGFYIYISDTFNEHHPNRGHLCYHDQQNGYANILQNITCDYPGQYVVIYNERNSPDASIELFDVEVFPCLDGAH